MTNDRPEEHTNAVDGAGEETDFHHSNAGKKEKKKDLFLAKWSIHPVDDLFSDIRQNMIFAPENLGCHFFSLLSTFEDHGSPCLMC